MALYWIRGNGEFKQFVANHVKKINSFAHNSRSSRVESRITGPLTTEELNRQRRFWEQQAQRNFDIEKDRVALYLQPNPEGVLECRGRVQGEYPVYLPDRSKFSQRVVEEAHQKTLHGGVERE